MLQFGKSATSETVPKLIETVPKSVKTDVPRVPEYPPVRSSNVEAVKSHIDRTMGARAEAERAAAAADVPMG